MTIEPPSNPDNLHASLLDNQRGKIRMIAMRRLASLLLLPFTIGLTGQAQAAPVTYTLQTVADGRIGSHPFHEAIVTITMRSDTKYVVNGSGPSAGNFVNKTGPVRVVIRDGTSKITAYFAPGQVYAFFDSVTGVAGFGSNISPTYPFALDCNNYPDPTTYTQDCVTGSSNSYDGTLGSVAAGVLPGPQSLTASGLLTGKTHSCAGLYNFAGFYSGDLGSCAAAATQGLQTDRGMLYFQDQIGGTTDGNSPFGWAGWDTSNSGFMNVEVGP
jgi:hypothetical protein